MTPAEAGRLLTIAAAFDNRKPDADTARAWSVALDGYRFEDCREAIVQHVTTSDAYLMPVHVIAGVKKLRAARIAAVGTLCPPPDLTEAEEREWIALERRRIGDGLAPSPDPRVLVAGKVPDLRALTRRVEP